MTARAVLHGGAALARLQVVPGLAERPGAGRVSDRAGRGAGGPCYQWTRKEKGKTISVAMSVEQYEAMAEAIANGKKAKQILRRMGQISRRIIFATLPDTKRSKPLTDEVLGLS